MKLTTTLATLLSISFLGCGGSETPPPKAATETPSERLAQHSGRFFIAKLQSAPEDDAFARMAEAALTTALGRHFADGVVSHHELENVTEVAALSGILGNEQEAETLRRLAQAVDAKYLAVGSVARVGDLLALSIALYDVAQNRVLNRISERGHDPNALLATIETDIREMYDLPSRVPPEQIKALIESKRGLVRYCYTKTLERDPTAAGKAFIRFVIEPDGTVSDVGLETEGSTLTDEGFKTCVEVAIMSLNLGFSIDNELRVTYPFTFSPN